ncbi:hypothetical protein QYZ59_14435 [Clostridium perfringens]|jgi:hypothetical protein|uniref:Uncharacterized protein n=1 Tax=Clostridium perfringens (strain 13 / Type A) TaxID=195102 RepID=Q93MD4_CLOPE|nr:hypothetical protein [Clostridium perfringens]BAB62451.1 hypothetical protein [Clostridium perfringens str. 13]MDK0742973.1 hypothetical protein [Clostridium perfringens]MDK0911547.1 hypothetical protein [Clostridium perfringens]MDK0987373.1 hypothetical protein [Clostridium perfringens]MDM0687228.1 hypothetical protein [Clostridium perfringens]
MTLLCCIISLCCSSWMFIYLYGLSATSSSAYNSVLYIFPCLFLIISLYLFYKIAIDDKN